MFSEIKVTAYEGETQAVFFSWSTYEGLQGDYTLYMKEGKWCGSGSYIGVEEEFVVELLTQWGKMIAVERKM